jgi:acyl-coenzyme A synthetase/AMP-(fatty) acid ligase/SAM-dependent methyltransferase/uncharacterized protein YbaR (Trm112 family)
LRNWMVDHLVCPACKCGLQADSYECVDDSILEGYLACASCATLTPVSRGFPLFTETRLDTGNLDDHWLTAQGKSWFRTEEYPQFVREKAARQLRDSYALFQSFNESSRSLLAVVELLREGLAPGDLVLDTWCRTGWSGEWLATLFPEQHVISLWEGNSNVLGYAGFQYWLPEHQRASNLSVFFTHADRHLPLRTDSVKLLIGLDSLHRYAQDSFLPECLRVVKEDGVLFFPHIHLTNSEPEPFFERGCMQLSGDEWQFILDAHCKTGKRQAYLFAEPELFSAGDSFTIRTNPGTSHYNGAALIGPQAWNGRTVTTAHAASVSSSDHLILNSLVEIDLDRAEVKIAADKPGLQVGEMLLRHPVYERKLKTVLGHKLAEIECEVLFHSQRCENLQQICDLTGRAEQVVQAAVKALCAREIIFPASVSQAMANLQSYYGYLRIPPQAAASFAELWSQLGARYQAHPIMIDGDGTEYDFASIDTMVNATVRWLQHISSHGDRILVATGNCPELFVLIWACWLSGRVAVPVDADAHAEAISDFIARTTPVACFSQQALDHAYFQFDSLATDTQSATLFSDQISRHIDDSEPLRYEGGPRDLAAILFTSGSTGKPKGVRLSQSSLLHSGAVLAETYHWKAAGRLLSLGATHSMSGLRNPAVAALSGGMSIVLPSPGIKHPIQIYGLLAKHAVTHLSTVPSLLMSFEKLLRPLAAEPRPEALQQIISTGYNLPDTTRDCIAAFFGKPVYSYYGLTETGGICLADTVGTAAEGNLGFAVGAIAQVRDARDNVLGPGYAGELCIYSPGRASGYLGENISSSVRFRDGWVYTGDIALLAADGSFHYIGRRDDQVKDRRGETLFLQEVEAAASALEDICDCCCAIQPGHASDMDGLILFAVTSQQPDNRAFTSAIFTKLTQSLGTRRLPAHIVQVPSVIRFSNGKADRAAMLKYLDASQ